MTSGCCTRAWSWLRTCWRRLSRSSRCARDRKSTRLNSSHREISYAVFCLKKKPQAAEVIATLSADGVEHGLLTLPDVDERYTNGIDVQATGQPAIGCDPDEHSFLDWPLVQEWMRRPGRPAGHLGEHLSHPVLVRPSGV